MAQVSVIIPTYNRAHLIGRAITSVLRQSYKDFEIVVVDDGSTDDTKAVVMAFGDDRIIYKRLPMNKGVHEARNRGMELATGECLAFLDSDDELLPQALERCTNMLSSLPSDVGVIFAAGQTYPSGELTGFDLESSGFVNWPDILCQRRFKPLKNCLAIVKKSCVGNTRWEMQGFDFVFWRRIAKRWRVFFLNEVLMVYHTNGNPDRLSNLRRRKSYRYAAAKRASAAYRAFLEEFGGELKVHCPKTYGDYLYGFATTSLIAGKRADAAKSAVTAAIDGKTLSGLLLLPLCLLPGPVVKMLYLAGGQS